MFVRLGETLSARARVTDVRFPVPEVTARSDGRGGMLERATECEVTPVPWERPPGPMQRRGCLPILLGILAIFFGIPMLILPGPGMAAIAVGLGLIAVGLGFRR